MFQIYLQKVNEEWSKIHQWHVNRWLIKCVLTLLFKRHFMHDVLEYLWDKDWRYPEDLNLDLGFCFQQKTFKPPVSWPVMHFSNIFNSIPHAHSITLIWQTLWIVYIKSLTYRWIIDPRCSLTFSYEC